jgi:hypothetical protein
VKLTGLREIVGGRLIHEYNLPWPAIERAITQTWPLENRSDSISALVGQGSTRTGTAFITKDRSETSQRSNLIRGEEHKEYAYTW